MENALQDKLPVNQVPAPARRLIMVELVLNGWTLSMQVGTRAAVFLISSATFTQSFPDATLSKSRAVLTTYTGNKIPLAGQKELEVSHNNQRLHLTVYVSQNNQHQFLTVYVTNGQGPSLSGWEWLRALKLD